MTAFHTLATWLHQTNNWNVPIINCTRSSRTFTYFSHAYQYCQKLYWLHLATWSHRNGSQVFQPCSDLWYRPKIRSRISKICLCISISNSERWSRNIVMMSRWFAFKRTSSSKGRSHSMRTSIVWTIRKILVNFSNPTIHSMYLSSIASRSGRLSRLSIPGIDYVAILSLSLNAWATHIPVISQLLSPKTSRQVVGVSTVQTPTLVTSRTYSQPQPIKIFSTLLSRQSIDKSLSTHDLQPTCHKKEWNKTHITANLNTG